MSTLEEFAVYGDSGTFPPDELAKKIKFMDPQTLRERRV
jgi:hypothetical protein